MLTDPLAVSVSDKGPLFRWAALSLVACLVSVSACAGEKGDAEGGDDDDSSMDDKTPGPDGACVAGKAAPFQLRRLTRSQLDHTVADLLGTEVKPSAVLSADERVGPFSSNLNVPIDDLLVERFEGLAQTLTAGLKPESLVDCADRTGRACAEFFVGDLGRRVFRRPVEQEQKDLYLSFYDAEAPARGHEDALRLVLRAMLQSPYFLYHAEFGADDGRLTGFEVANRLSYFLWDTMPDRGLLDAAESGGLDDAAGIAAQVERMLGDAKAGQGRLAFHFAWLGLDALKYVAKNTKVYPRYTPSMQAAMESEAEQFVEHVFREGDGRLETLLTSNLTFPSDALASVYGLTDENDKPLPIAAGPFEMPRDQRSGLLTLPAFLTVHSHADQSSPVQRGVAVRNRLLCQELPSPPDNVNNAIPAVAPDATTRQRFAAHQEDPSCAGCHKLIDNIGLGFENYDAIGQYRTSENDLPIDATGEVIGAGDLDGPFEGATQLASRLGTSVEVSGCMARQWFSFALGRAPTDGDACLVNDLTALFVDSGGDLRVLLAAIATSPAFNHLIHVEGATP